jgi:putative nucleotidyltransferase with HDIG domain
MEAPYTNRSFSFEDVTVDNDLILDALSAWGIKPWMEMVRRHHSPTYKHSLLVTGFAVTLAQKLNIRQADQQRLARAGLLHDIGKAFIPLSILDKPGTLTDQEMAEVRKHPGLGHQLLVQQGGFPEEILDCVRHHHELLDGSGYPDGLKGPQITDLVRIVTIADIFAALIEERAYRKSLPASVAFRMMQEMGSKLDPALLNAFHLVVEDAE